MPDDMSTGDYLLDKDGNEVEITSISEVHKKKLSIH